MTKGKLPSFYYRHKSGKYFEDKFWLEQSYLPFFDSSAIQVFAYGENIYKAEANLSVIHPYWSLRLIQNGTAFLHYNNITRKISPGDFLILHPKIRYTCTVPKNSLISQKVILVNNGQIMSILCNQEYLLEDDIIHLAEPHKVNAIYENIKHIIQEDTGVFQELSVFAYSLIMEVFAQIRGKDIRGNFNIITKQISANISEHYSLQSLSEQFNIQPRTLTRMFIENLNCTPIQYIINIRMKYASQLLTVNTMSIQHIAELCGYNSMSFFIRSFKKHFGMTPGEYRKSHIIE